MLPHLANRADIKQWAEQRTAQHDLPRLVGLLAYATLTAPKRIAFRIEEGVQLSGWDGVIETAVGNAAIPDGLSGWELSTNQDPATKATRDYNTRCSDPFDVEPRTATFVYATPRSWNGKDTWAREKRAEGRWSDVRAYDVDDLAGWLEQAPVVHVWFSELIRKDPSGIRTIDSYWGDWTQATSPNLSTALVVGGRTDALADVHEWLRGDEAVLTIKADTREEAVAFFAAALHELPAQEGEKLSASVLIIDDSAVWARIIQAHQKLVLVPLGGPVEVPLAVRNGHRVVIPALTSAAASGSVLELARPRRQALEESLGELGLSDEKTQELASVGRRSPITLRRRLAIAPLVEHPAWADPDPGRTLVGPLLAGAWDEASDADKDALAELANTSYETVAVAAARWAASTDPPIRRVGTTWYITSRQDAWNLLSPLLTAEDLARFTHIVNEVLGTSLPAMELPVDERWMAAVLGKGPRWSPALTSGLAEIVALIGARASDTALPNGHSGDQFASAIVSDLLQSADRDDSAGLWTSLATSGVLPLLAEAAPNAFLIGVEEGISGADPVLVKLFTDSEPGNVLTSSSAHTGVLWALEALAWSARHVGRVCAALARMTKLDPGGHLANRPASSLRSILLPWHPQTTASVEERLEILDTLRRSEPAVVWDLMIGLLPEPHAIAIPSGGPRWRDWKPDDNTVTVGEWTAYIGRIVQRLVDDAGRNGDRWASLIERLDDLPPDLHDQVAAVLESLDPLTLAEPDRDRIVTALQALISRHRRHASAGWAMPTEQVDILASIYNTFQDQTFTRGRDANLFSHHPNLTEVDETGWEAYNATVDRARVAAVDHLIESDGIHGILDLAHSAELPDQVGRALAAISLASDQEQELLEYLDDNELAGQRLAQGYVATRGRDPESSWVTTMISDHLSDWSAERQARFMLALPSTQETFAQVENLPENAQTMYWSHFWPVALADPAVCDHAVDRLLSHGRAHVALDLLGLYVDRRDDPFSPELIVRALSEAAVTWPADEASAMAGRLSYGIAQLFEYLDTQDIDDADLAALEFTYLPILERSERSPRLLHQRLAEDPAFLIEAVSIVYPAEDDEEPRELTDAERTRVQLVLQLLDGWDHPPGLTDAGTIDDTLLRRWVKEARAGFETVHRVAIGDQTIGRALRYVNSDGDVWPAPIVRDLIEELAGTEVELGLEAEVLNSRGFITRSLTEGGAQARALEQRYRLLADDATNKWPRTASMLNRIADYYSALARREDDEADLREDFWR